MQAWQKYLEILALATQSEWGRQMVQRMLAEAAMLALADIKDAPDEYRAMDLLQAILDGDEWVHHSQWFPAFEKRLADLSLPVQAAPSLN